MQPEVRRHRQLFEAFRSVDESEHLAQSPRISNQAFSVARLKEAAQAFGCSTSCHNRMFKSHVVEQPLDRGALRIGAA